MTYDVIVVGGGIAGLTAAQALAAQGRKVGLFEAKNALGGRIQSTPSTQGVLVNVGAGLLEAGKQAINPLHTLIKKQGIKTKQVNPALSQAFDTQGNLVNIAEVNQSLSKAYEKVFDRVRSAKRAIRTTHKSGYPVLSEVLDFSKNAEYANTQAEPPKPDTTTFWTQKFIIASIEQHTGANLDEVSLLELMQNNPEVAQETMLVLPATQLIGALVTEIESTKNVTMHLNTELQKIRFWSNDNTEHNQTGFELTFKNGLHHTTQALILALPFSILKLEKIQFEPALSAQKRKAFSHCGISHYNTVYLEFEHPFWDKKAHYIFPNGESVEDWPQYLNLAAFTNPAVPGLLIQYYGDAARFGKKSDADILKQALAPLEHVFGEQVSQLKSYFISHFDTDPHILGGSLYYSKKTQTEDLDALLIQEMPGLYFAGDYLNAKEHGTLKAASFSGLKAAWDVDTYLRYRSEMNAQKPLRSPKR